MPISSLGGLYGIGSVGKKAFEFVDFLKSAGQSYWQILPIGPTGYGDSPYQSFSAFAANPYYIDLDVLHKEKLLSKAELKSAEYKGSLVKIDYQWLYETRFEIYRLAMNRFDLNNPDYLEFCKNEQDWIYDYAEFMAIKNENGGVSFTLWPTELRLRRPEALEAAKARLFREIQFWCFLQYIFFKQWNTLKSYANNNGVKIIGDIPIYVSPDSAELWAKPQMFQTDENGLPTRVAGCPPDAFSASGQLWGNPLYKWDYHINTNYQWWEKRLLHAGRVYDVVRIDHFRGFEAYYSIDAAADNAMGGRWEEGPGLHFIEALHKIQPKLSLIAEDLGYLTPKVHEMLKASTYPGMKVLQFAFDKSGNSDYLPHNYNKNCIVYTGTHDNNTTTAWQQDISKQDLAFARQYLNACTGNVCTAMIRAAFASVADTAIIPMGDWLELKGDCRINYPSTVGGNWEWRISDNSLSKQLSKNILTMSRVYSRI